jgi:hypothetical protein
MKMHTKKRAYRLACKRIAQDGRINTAQGQWVGRGTVNTSMGRDYSPQTGK